MTTVANGRCTSAPADMDNAIGKNPKMSVASVSKIGLILSLVPVRIRSLMLIIPSSFNVLNRFIKTNPSSTAMPNSTIKPIPAEMLKGISRNQRANTPPIAANGIAV